MSLLTSKPAPAAPPPPSVPVTVVNTPLPVQGAINAKITNAYIPVSGTVTVSNLPTVQTVQFNGTPNVNVATSDRAPLVVEPDVAAALNEITLSCGPATFNQYGQAGCSLYTVPSGSNLVVDNVSAQATLTPGEYLTHMEVGTENIIPPLVLANSYLVPAVLGTAPGGVSYYAAQAHVKLYVQGPGNIFGCSMEVGGGGSAPSGGLNCSFAAHLVPQ